MALLRSRVVIAAREHQKHRLTQWALLACAVLGALYLATKLADGAQSQDASTMREMLLQLANASRGDEPAQGIQLPLEAGDVDPEAGSGSGKIEQPSAGGLAAAAGIDPKGRQFVQATLTEEGEEYGEDTSDEGPDIDDDDKEADARRGGQQQQEEEETVAEAEEGAEEDAPQAEQQAGADRGTDMAVTGREGGDQQGGAGSLLVPGGDPTAAQEASSTSSSAAEAAAEQALPAQGAAGQPQEGQQQQQAQQQSTQQQQQAQQQSTQQQQQQAAGGGITDSGGEVQRLCTNTCATANNGVCDEGRRKGGSPGPPPGQRDPGVYSATCELGTDCGDCGEWAHQGPAEATTWEPITMIRAKGFAVNVRQTATPVPFWIAYTDPANDTDLSRHLHNDALAEGGITALAHRILKEGCVGADGSRRLVLDVGASFGYYTLLAASLGCRVVAWEPVPHFSAFLRYGLLRNNLTDSVQVRDGRGVADDTSSDLSVIVPRRGPWGTAGRNGLNVDRSANTDADLDSLMVPAERIDAVVKEDVLLMKVDIEGFEPFAIKSAAALLQNFKVENIILDYDPSAAERAGEWKLYEAHPATLARLLNAGYQVLHLAGLQAAQGWEGSLPPLESVTGEVLKQDLEDAQRLMNGTLGCPMTPDLQKWLWGCNTLPEALHPQSFRATFERSTALWAVRQGAPARALLPQAGPAASLFPLDWQPEKYFTPHEFGMARRACASLEPRLQVKNRCRCSQAGQCGELEALVSKEGAAGHLPPRPPASPVRVEQLLLSDW